MLYLSDRLKDVTAKPMKEQFSPTTGEKIGHTRRVFAQFRRGGIPAWATQYTSKFAMTGKPIEIEATTFICSYDSEEDQRIRSWTDEERRMIEAKLARSSHVLAFEKPRKDAPFANWIKLTKAQGQRTVEQAAAKAADLVREMGLEIDEVIAFEKQEERKESEAIIAAVEGLRVTEEVEPLITA